ncbi:MAG: tagaturonate epimerase family protein [Verrucomicrobiales bacterium]
MNAEKLPAPTVLGLKKSFGFGDRLGLATPGHLSALLKSDFAPIFAQQSIREMERTQRTPEEVMSAAQRSLAAANFRQPWGADADHLKTEADVEKTVAAGFTFFTIDPSAFVENRADTMTGSELNTAAEKLGQDGSFDAQDWASDYLNKAFEVSDTLTVRFEKEQLLRAAVKYGRAVAHCEKMGRHIAKTCAQKPFEIEVSVDETDSPTTPPEHLFFGLELKKRGVKVVSLAPRFIGEFEKGIDFKGDLNQFESTLKEHVAIARFCGPYKISVHSGSDKFSAYPVCGRVCGDLLHVKTAGTSYLEALRVVCRRDKQFFSEIVEFSRSRFDNDRRTYHISTTLEQVMNLPAGDGKDREQLFLEEIPGRQLLHVTFGSVLTVGKRPNGQTFRAALLELLNNHPGDYIEVLDKHFTKHLSMLNAG